MADGTAATSIMGPRAPPQAEAVPPQKPHVAMVVEKKNVCLCERETPTSLLYRVPKKSDCRIDIGSARGAVFFFFFIKSSSFASGSLNARKQKIQRRRMAAKNRPPPVLDGVRHRVPSKKALEAAALERGEQQQNVSERERRRRG